MEQYVIFLVHLYVIRDLDLLSLTLCYSVSFAYTRFYAKYTGCFKFRTFLIRTFCIRTLFLLVSWLALLRINAAKSREQFHCSYLLLFHSTLAQHSYGCIMQIQYTIHRFTFQWNTLNISSSINLRTVSTHLATWQKGILNVLYHATDRPSCVPCC